MRFLVDQAVSWKVADDLKTHGHDSIHVRDIGLADADDRLILQSAFEQERIIVTQNADFGELLAASSAAAPSVIRLRVHDAHPQNHTRLVAENLSKIEEPLVAGAIVVIGDKGIRIRRLPILK
jgi:predicted nuclease of predicted toxin-antitoxin system